FARHTTITVPHDLPFVPDSAQPALRLLTKGAEQADDAERERNPRSAPVRLRAVERVRAAA
ncbi:MAG: rRNA (cytosine1402-N4)-methyltransferase, partial [Frankiaceae bacterium]|nr:rRNA (cytosine1402-N4)-methyltransferase [Frankiaceae bacterium]